MLSTVTSLLFDLDGTLTDPKEGITRSVEYALNQFGQTVAHPDELIPYIGPPLYDSFIELAGMSPEDAQKAVGYYRERYRVTGIYENMVIPGIPALLTDLRNMGFSLYVATSKPTVFAEEILRYYGLDGFVKFVGGSNLDGTRSKKAEVIAYVLEQNGLKPEESLMIGDRKHDIIGAAACGVLSLGVTFGYGTEAELSAAGADFIAYRVEEIREMLSLAKC